MKKKSAKVKSKSKKDELIILRIPEDISVEDFKKIKKYCKNHKITVNKFFDDAVDEMLTMLKSVSLKEARKMVDAWQEPKVEEKKVEEIYCDSGWLSELGSKPIRVVDSHDQADSYDTDNAMVWELENGKFAYILESGCSCYETNDAMIEVYETEELAMNEFNAWKRN